MQITTSSQTYEIIYHNCGYLLSFKGICCVYLFIYLFIWKGKITKFWNFRENTVYSGDVSTTLSNIYDRNFWGIVELFCKLGSLEGL